MHFITKLNGLTVANLRQFAHTDITAASRLGWFIDCRMQQFLTACAGSEHIGLVEPDLFDF